MSSQPASMGQPLLASLRPSFFAWVSSQLPSFAHRVHTHLLYRPSTRGGSSMRSCLQTWASSQRPTLRTLRRLAGGGGGAAATALQSATRMGRVSGAPVMHELCTCRIVVFVLHSQANAHMDEHSASCYIYCHSLHSIALLLQYPAMQVASGRCTRWMSTRPTPAPSRPRCAVACTPRWGRVACSLGRQVGLRRQPPGGEVGVV